MILIKKINKSQWNSNLLKENVMSYYKNIKLSKKLEIKTNLLEEILSSNNKMILEFIHLNKKDYKELITQHSHHFHIRLILPFNKSQVCFRI
jgi:hypothetical protein